ncbi:uncharacterized protein CCOS01_01060 [Colletotrichum costaricense]|uniref:Uncharacterized protein n=1 Tax=Colletotrichum costaricense TaxID=1209916 RepID=A0AAJ0E7R0_9PEZI|nr:uncharacterized protein CCOS01_01060 [Colletotrichum costaricense]KAK1539746.1 hypothetical protein CCOS01_01060 [Colletotrichum costaricense]
MYGYHLASPLAIIRATLLFRRRRGRRTSRRKHYFHTVTETQRQTLTQAQKGRADPEKGRHGPITPQIPYPNASGLVPPLRLLPHPVFWSVLPHLPGETFHCAHNEGSSWRFLEVRCMQMQLHHNHGDNNNHQHHTKPYRCLCLRLRLRRANQHHTPLTHYSTS